MPFHPLLLFFKDMLMVSKTFAFRSWDKGFFKFFFFHSKPLIEHLIIFSFVKSLYLLISRYQCPFLFHLQVPQWFSFSLFVEVVGEAFAYFLDTHVSFQDFSFNKTPPFLIRLAELSYFAVLIKILRILFTCILSFLGFSTIFSLLVDILKYIHSHHFLILASSAGCNPSQRYLTKEKHFTSTQIRTARDILFYKR